MFLLLFIWIVFVSLGFGFYLFVCLLVNSHSMQYRHAQSTAEPFIFVSAIFTRIKGNPSYLMNSHTRNKARLEPHH